MSGKAVVVLGVVYLVVGVSVGLLGGWAWQLAPGGCRVQELGGAYLDDYILALAVASRGSGDVGMVRRELPSLSDEDIGRLAEAAAERMLRAPSQDEEELVALVNLATRFGRVHRDLLVYAASPQLETAETETGLATAEAEWSGADSLLAEPEFVVARLQALCDRRASEHRLELLVEDECGEPLPGTLVRLRWEGGTRDAYTGLKRPGSPGYADFRLEEERLDYWVVLLGEAQSPISEEAVVSVEAAKCRAGERVTWQVRFVRARRG